MPEPYSNSTPVLADLAARINKAHGEASAAMSAGIAHAVEAGKALCEAKELVAHGEWLPWLAESTGITARMAQRYMRIARAAADPQKATRVTHLPLRHALAVLAEPKPPRLLRLPVTCASGNASDELWIAPSLQQ